LKLHAVQTLGYQPGQGQIYMHKHAPTVKGFIWNTNTRHKVYMEADNRMTTLHHLLYVNLTAIFFAFNYKLLIPE